MKKIVKSRLLFLCLVSLLIALPIAVSLLYFHHKNDYRVTNYFTAKRQYIHGHALDEKGHHKSAIKWYWLASLQNHPSASNELGEAYRDGEGVNKNYTKATKYFEKAAQLRHRFAYYNLGYLYKDINNPYKNIDKSIEYFKLAGKNGFGDAYADLSKLYWYGVDKSTYNIASNETQNKDIILENDPKISMEFLSKAIKLNGAERYKDQLSQYYGYHGQIKSISNGAD